MSCQIEWRRAQDETWTTLTGPDGRPLTFTTYDSAERLIYSRADERLDDYSRIRLSETLGGTR